MKKLFTLCLALLAASVSAASDVESVVFAEVEEQEEERFIYDRTFPLLAQEAYDRGYELPKPYGFTFNYMKMDQPLHVTGVDIHGLRLNCGPISQLLCNQVGDEINLSDLINSAHQESETFTLRGDMWFLPFWNFYGVVGVTSGSSKAPIELAGNHLADFDLTFKGTTYGGGTTIVGGVGNWFALVDVNYTYTDLDILDGEITTLVAAPRVGYRYNYKGHDVQLWVGGMYQDVQQTFSGNIHDLDGIGDVLSTLCDGSWTEVCVEEGKFTVSQRLVSKWNTVIGSQVALTDGIDLLFEMGFGQRKSMMLGLGYRF
ncbi:hypothetical protein [Aliagarivorans marinus]|uniref:hypothetical protein n=1 Tax=Aliagarivorans marinus TaxID=561965 RepID=UPI0004035259|nr:hypothetical protein [Aliagarivorans marinus]